MAILILMVLVKTNDCYLEMDEIQIELNDVMESGRPHRSEQLSPEDVMGLEMVMGLPGTGEW